MKHISEPQFRREILTYIILSAALGLAGLFVSPLTGLCLFIAGATFTALHLYFSKKRYDRIGELSQSIDRILHGQDQVLISSHDEGELSILSSEIQKMTVRLREQADQLTADKIQLTEAIEDIFHQLRTPLTSMNLVVTMLESGDLTPERRLRLTRELKTQLERIRWLVETLLKMSKLDAGTAAFKKERIPVARLVDKAVHPFLIPMELRGQTFSVDTNDAAITGDMDWTAEAIANILKNCMEHTPEGGTISVSAAETPLFTQIIIRDTGGGFDPEDIPNLFHRFYRGKNAAPTSIGIGLALARLIIASQNGTVTAQNSSDNTGAEFLIRFYKTVV